MVDFLGSLHFGDVLYAYYVHKKLHVHIALLVVVSVMSRYLSVVALLCQVDH